MLRKAMIALAAATLWAMVVPQAASACYGFGPAFAPCGGVGLALFAPRLYYGYPDPYSYSYSGIPRYAYGGFAVSCYLIRRPVLGLQGWQTRTVPVCD